MTGHALELPLDLVPLARPRPPTLAEKLARAVQAGQERTPLDVARSRLLVCMALLTLAFAVIVVRLIDLMAVSPPHPTRPTRAAATAPHGPTAAPIPGGRAEIVDRNGALLAISLSAPSLYADATKVSRPEEAARRLAQALPEASEATLRERLLSGKKFVYLHRNLTPRQQYEVNRLGIPGLAFEQESLRRYPHRGLAAHVVGFVDVDGQGLAGVERGLNERLSVDGAPLELSIDLGVQHVVREELRSAIQRFSAIGGAAMVMDARTGEILAMVSAPDFDPNEPGQATDDARFNRATLGVYEMGSTMKVFNTAMALDAGATTMTGGFDATRPIEIGRFTISDYHGKKRWLSTPEIFMYSSNIGSVRMAMAVGVPGQRAFFDKLGFLKAPEIELKEVGSPQVPKPWRPINLMTISFGHGISISPLHLIQATAAMVNGGRMIQATLLRRPADAPAPGAQVISPQTSALMRRLMRLVVERGTGRQAGAGPAEGYLVGGKTGTAEKIGRRGYNENARISSFVGAFPMQDPRYVVLVMVDEPKGIRATGGYATGGAVAAPAVAQIVGRIAPMLGMPAVDERAPEIAKLLAVDLGAGGPRAQAH